MQIGDWTFQPKLLPSIAAVIMFFVLVLLGVWQLDRADQKTVLYEQFIQKGKDTPVDINREITIRLDLENVLWRRGIARGHYQADIHLLLDNQVRSGKTGYYVFTPLRLEQEQMWLLVNRGWVPAGAYRDEIPTINTPEGKITIKGTIKAPPASGIILSEHTMEKLMPGLIRLQNLNLENIENVTKLVLLPYVIRLESPSSDGFIREWRSPGSGKEKHLGYAFQWFALATVLLVIYLVVNMKRSTNTR